MIIKLNYDLLTYKKDSKIDLEKIPFKKKQYFLRRLEDSSIDKCIEVINETKKSNIKEDIIKK